MNDYLNFPTEEEMNRQNACPAGSAGDPQNNRRAPAGRKKLAAILCACLVASAATGLTGGYLGASLAVGQLRDDGASQSVSQAQPSSTTVSQDGPSGVMTVSQVVSAVSNTVVEINTEVQTTNFMMQPVTAEAAGSGVIISQDGYIMTNNHVIEDAQNIRVRLQDGTTYEAELVGADAQTDIAVIKIDATGLNFAQMGDSSSQQVGDDAIVIGNPLGELGGTVTNGIISAVNREITIDGEAHTVIQTNAAINRGNSGGGLFNGKGELIGIVVAKSSGTDVEGLGYAIPIDIARDVASDLVSHGYVTGRGKMGISTIDINDSRTAFMYRVPQTGIYIAEIEPGSAAQSAGLKTADGIAAVNGQEIASSAELKNEMTKYRAGDTVELTILRDGSTLTVSVTLDESVPSTVVTQEA